MKDDEDVGDMYLKQSDEDLKFDLVETFCLMPREFLIFLMFFLFFL